MGLEARLKNLAKYHGLPLDNVMIRYDRAYQLQVMAHGKEYINRDSHLRYFAYRLVDEELQRRREFLHKRVN